MFTRQTYSNQVVSFIKKMIQKGELSPGEPVKELVLSERLGISRAPIREALQILISEGLVDSEPQKGKKVREVSEKDIRDSYAVGGILEAAGVASSLDMWKDEDMQALAAVVESMHYTCTRVSSLETLSEMDDLFHCMLLKHCDNMRLTDMARSSCVTISKFLCYQHWLQLYTPCEFYERHDNIAKAIYSKNKEHVEHLLREHYQEIGNRMAQRIHPLSTH